MFELNTKTIITSYKTKKEAKKHSKNRFDSHYRALDGHFFRLCPLYLQIPQKIVSTLLTNSTQIDLSLD